MQDEMKNVARIIEATRVTPSLKTIEVEVKAKTERASAILPKPRSQRFPPTIPTASIEPSGMALRTRENVTTRLTSETNARLTEAALHQKLKRTHPDTRQDIIEDAVIDWFKKHGYDRRKKPVAASKSELSEATLAASQESAEEGPDEEPAA